MFSLPWLANNSLKEEEANQLKKAIDKSPELQKELDFLISMRTQVKMSARLYKVTDLDWKKLERDIKNQPKINYLTRLSVYSSMLSNYAAVAATLVLGLYLSNTYLEHNKEPFYAFQFQ